MKKKKKKGHISNPRSVHSHGPTQEARFQGNNLEDFLEWIAQNLHDPSQPADITPPAGHNKTKHGLNVQIEICLRLQHQQRPVQVKKSIGKIIDNITLKIRIGDMTVSITCRD